MKTLDKVVMGAVLVAVITNPVSGGYILEGLEYGFGWIFRYASPVNFLALGIVALYIAVKMWESRDTTKIPAKTKKTKSAGKFLEA
jgi:hypothetical protein